MPAKKGLEPKKDYHPSEIIAYAEKLKKTFDKYYSTVDLKKIQRILLDDLTGLEQVNVNFLADHLRLHYDNLTSKLKDLNHLYDKFEADELNPSDAEAHFKTYQDAVGTKSSRASDAGSVGSATSVNKRVRQPSSSSSKKSLKRVEEEEEEDEVEFVDEDHKAKMDKIERLIKFETLQNDELNKSLKEELD